MTEGRNSTNDQYFVGYGQKKDGQMFLAPTFSFGSRSHAPRRILDKKK